MFLLLFRNSKTAPKTADHPFIGHREEDKTLGNLKADPLKLAAPPFQVREALPFPETPIGLLPLEKIL